MNRNLIEKNPMFDLKDKVAIITGGTGVLGSAIAVGLINAGAKVGILGRTANKVEKKIAKLEILGGEALALIADVLDEDQLINAKNKVLKKWGHIDILINAAGGNRKGATIMPNQSIFDLNLAEFSKVHDLNLNGTVLPTIVFGQRMSAQKSGCIINISSMAAQLPLTRIVGYSASKAAIDNFTKWMAVEMANKFGEGIRVNAIAPGFFLAEQNRRLLTNEDGTLTERGQTIVDQTPMKRFGEPKELISTVLWLCSDASSFITGIVVPVDGGFSAFSGV